MDTSKVLLMGPGGSGKTSMRSIIFANFVARDTSKMITPTVEIDRSQVRFLGNLTLNLWDCGGQEKYLETYFTGQREQIFKNVSVLIFVFDVKSKSPEKDYEDYCRVIDTLSQHSRDAKVFVLLHKMDLIPKEQRDKFFEQRKSQLVSLSQPFAIQCFQTSIWHDTLYKAWSTIVYSLIPNADLLAAHLQQFTEACEAEEVVLFEKATFLDISHSTNRESRFEFKDPHRFEKISNIIKMFKLSCMKMRSAMTDLHFHNSEFDAFINEFTSNTYIMVIVSDPDVKSATTLMNIRTAKKHFERLIATSF